jgi:hypothetical protein
MKSESLVKVLVVLVLALGVGFVAYTMGYAMPRRELLKELQKHRDANAAFEVALKRRPDVRAGLKAIAESTLGASRDEVDARFRDSLQRIGAACNLSGIVVNTESPDPQENPLRRARGLTGSAYGKLKQELRQPDFSAIAGTLTGTGTLEEVLRAMAMVRQQPWVHRVQSFSIKPEGKERARFTLKLGVTTVLLNPELAPKERGEPVIVALADDAAAAWRGMVSKNIFREPPPPPAPVVAAAPAQPKPPAPAPPRPPYDDWKLTGVVQSRLGIEAFLVNTKSGQQLTLPTGSAVADARFVDGEGERAIFEIEGQQFEISNGQTLEQRRLLSR